MTSGGAVGGCFGVELNKCLLRRDDEKEPPVGGEEGGGASRVASGMRWGVVVPLPRAEAWPLVAAPNDDAEEVGFLEQQFSMFLSLSLMSNQFGIGKHRWAKAG